MKKIFYFALLATMICSANALAQRKNTTSHDVKPVVSQQIVTTEQDTSPMVKYDCNCKECLKTNFCAQNCMCDKSSTKHLKHKKNKKHHEKIKDIQEEYNEAVEKINNSNLNEEQKKLLIQQANENKSLALKQQQDWNDLHILQQKQRNDANIYANKENKKLLKKIDKLD